MRWTKWLVISPKQIQKKTAEHILKFLSKGFLLRDRPMAY